jgi:hypothetical protein
MKNCDPVVPDQSLDMVVTVSGGAVPPVRDTRARADSAAADDARYHVRLWQAGARLVGASIWPTSRTDRLAAAAFLGHRSAARRVKLGAVVAAGTPGPTARLPRR